MHVYIIYPTWDTEQRDGSSRTLYKDGIFEKRHQRARARASRPPILMWKPPGKIPAYPFCSALSCVMRGQHMCRDVCQATRLHLPKQLVRGVGGCARAERRMTRTRTHLAILVIGAHGNIRYTAACKHRGRGNDYYDVDAAKSELRCKSTCELSRCNGQASQRARGVYRDEERKAGLEFSFDIWAFFYGYVCVGRGVKL